MSEKNRSNCIRPHEHLVPHFLSRKQPPDLQPRQSHNLVEEGTRVVISPYSNGPQVGMIHTAMNEFAGQGSTSFLIIHKHQCPYVLP